MPLFQPVVDDEFSLSAEFIRRQIGGHGYCRAEISRLGRVRLRRVCLWQTVYHGRAGARPSEKIRRLKSALIELVIN